MLKGKKSEGLSLSLEKKTITLSSKDGVLVLEVSNQYGNSVKYEISDSYHFDNLLSNLWQFFKDNQH